MPAMEPISKAMFDQKLAEQRAFIEMVKSADQKISYDPNGPPGTHPIRFDSVLLSGTTFTDTELWGVEFNSCQLDKANFAGADLDDCKFYRCDLTEADMTAIWGENLLLENCTAHDSLWTDAVVLKSKFDLSPFPKANMDRFCALECSFIQCDLSDVKMRYSYMRDCDLTGAIILGMQTDRSWFSGCGRGSVMGDERIINDPNEDRYPQMDIDAMGQIIMKEYEDSMFLVPENIKQKFSEIVREDGLKEAASQWKILCRKWKDKRDQTDGEIQDNMLQLRIPVTKAVANALMPHIAAFLDNLNQENMAATTGNI